MSHFLFIKIKVLKTDHKMNAYFLTHTQFCLDVVIDGVDLWVQNSRLVGLAWLLHCYAGNIVGHFLNAASLISSIGKLKQ